MPQLLGSEEFPRQELTISEGGKCIIGLDHTKVTLYVFDILESLNQGVYSLRNDGLQSPDARHGEKAIQSRPPSFVLIMSYLQSLLSALLCRNAGVVP